MTNPNVIEFFKRLITGIILLVCFGGAYLHSANMFAVFLVAVLVIALFFEWPKLIPPSHFATTYTLMYPIIPFILLVWLTLTYYAIDFYLPLYPFFVAWTADSCGYAIGKLCGIHKMCPYISPGKSWEGFFGSLVGVFVMHLWIMPRTHFFTKIPITFWPKSILFSVTMTSIAFLGGLFLSYLKRQKNLKDAGSVLPGHGGFLDRFDAVLFVVYATALLVFFFK